MMPMPFTTSQMCNSIEYFKKSTYFFNVLVSMPLVMSSKIIISGSCIIANIRDKIFFCLYL